MKQTAVEQLGIAFRQWQKEWENYNGTKENKPVSYDKFIAPFLEMERQQIIDARLTLRISGLSYKEEALQYYNETYKK
jgi:hypothetical protein